MDGRRYVVCFNRDQAIKDRHNHETIAATQEGTLKQGDKSLIGNKDFQCYVAARSEHFTIDAEKIKAGARHDGLWVLSTSMDLYARGGAQVTLPLH